MSDQSTAPDVLFSAAEIAARVDELAADIAAALGTDIVAVPILTGAFVFAADLTRALWRSGVAVEFRPLRIRSYGNSMTVEQPPEIVMPIDGRIDGKTALVIDGVCDAGHTLAVAMDHLKAHGAARIASVVMVDKPVHRTTGIAPDFTGFACGDEFVVGYGMDAAGSLRHLPYVGVVRG